jgi:hypothetical protein
MSEYYEMDVDGDGRLDTVEVTEYEDGSAVALVDVDGDGYADYELDVTAPEEVEGPYDVSGDEHGSAESTEPPPAEGPVNPAVEDIVINSQLNTARMWADLPPL